MVESRMRKKRVAIASMKFLCAKVLLKRKTDWPDGEDQKKKKKRGTETTINSGS